MRFLGLGLSDRVPYARTIWLFRETLTRAGTIKGLFARIDAALRAADPSLPSVPARSGVDRTVQVLRHNLQKPGNIEYTQNQKDQQLEIFHGRRA